MTGAKRRLKVFLCHAHSDAPAVRDLFKYLRREGVDAWLDKEKLLPGVDWDREIRKAVRESDVVVVCLSREFNKAGYRQREVRLALDTEQEKPPGEIYIIPALLEECSIPDYLQKWHGVNLFEEGGRQKLVRALRVRASQLGISLRRRGRYGKPAPDRSNPLESPSDVSRLELIDSYSDIYWHIDSIEYHLFTYLMAHKGQVCNYDSIVRSLYRPEKWEGLSESQCKDLLLPTIRELWEVIEENPEDPRYLIDTGTGYKLDE